MMCICCLTTINMYCFSNQDVVAIATSSDKYTFQDWEYSINDDNTITITSYNGTDTDITIPNQINELPVTIIGQGAFWNSKIESVTIPDSVVELKEACFYSCKNLTNISVPTSVKNIERRAFIKEISKNTPTSKRSESVG